MNISMNYNHLLLIELNNIFLTFGIFYCLIVLILWMKNKIEHNFCRSQSVKIIRLTDWNSKIENTTTKSKNAWIKIICLVLAITQQIDIHIYFEIQRKLSDEKTKEIIKRAVFVCGFVFYSLSLYFNSLFCQHDWIDTENLHVF